MKSNNLFQLALAYVLVSNHYKLKINLKSFHSYCAMDTTEAKQYAKKIVESLHGYRDALSAFLQGNTISN